MKFLLYESDMSMTAEENSMSIEYWLYHSIFTFLFEEKFLLNLFFTFIFCFIFSLIFSKVILYTKSSKS